MATKTATKKDKKGAGKKTASKKTTAKKSSPKKEAPKAKAPKTAKVTRAQLIAATKDINDLIECDPALKVDSKQTVGSLIEQLNKHQKGEDKLLEEDYGNKASSSLKKESFETLIAAGIKGLPAEWTAGKGAKESKKSETSSPKEDKPKGEKEPKAKSKKKNKDDKKPNGRAIRIAFMSKKIEGKKGYPLDKLIEETVKECGAAVPTIKTDISKSKKKGPSLRFPKPVEVISKDDVKFVRFKEA